MLQYLNLSYASLGFFYFKIFTGCIYISIMFQYTKCFYHRKVLMHFIDLKCLVYMLVTLYCVLLWFIFMFTTVTLYILPFMEF